LVAAGDLSLIADSDLRRAVTLFLNAADDLEEDAERVNLTGSAFLEATVRLGGPWHSGAGSQGEGSSLPSISPTELENLRDDRETMGLAGLSHHATIVYFNELEKMSAAINSALLAINAARDG
jgi:L-cysteine desulfidase